MAAVDYFLKIDGIPGESTDSKHKGEIDLESWSWSEVNSGTHATGTGVSAGKVSMKDFQFTMRVNKASPKLFLACSTGDHKKEAHLVCRKAGKQQQEYLKIKFTDLLISSYEIGGSTGDIVPVDKISFSFSKIEITYAPQKADGTLDSPVVHFHDQKGNVGG